MTDTRIEKLKREIRDRDDMTNHVAELVAYAESLAAERHEALDGVKTLTETVNSLNGQNDRLRQELAALKSCPAMAEVDALSGDFTVEECDQPCLTTWMQRNKSLADIARRSIASREEVVGKLTDTERLIKWMVKHWDWTGKLESIAKGCVIEPWKENARLILEIVEGK